MANPYIQIHPHCLFAVGGRQNQIPRAGHDELYQQITGITTNEGQKLLAVGGMPDHVRVFVGISRATHIADPISAIKSDSSMKKMGHGKIRLTERLWRFFSYSRSQTDNVIRYVLNQKGHYEKRLFEDEYFELFKKFSLEYDEKYLFDRIGTQMGPILQTCRPYGAGSVVVV